MYRELLNKFAYSSLNKAIQIPDYHLMVGTAEELSPLPLTYSITAQVPSVVAENMNRMADVSNDDLMQKIADNQLEVNDINDNIGILAGMMEGGL